MISFLDSPNLIAAISSIGKHWILITNELSAKAMSFKGMNKLLKYFQIRSDAIVCNSYNAAKMWKDAYPVFRKKIKVIYNPVLINKGYKKEKRDTIGKKKIVVTASYQYLKNPVEFVKAVGMLDDDTRSCIQVDWYGRSEVNKGDTRAYDETSSLILSLGLQDTVRLHEAINDIYSIIESADVVGLFSTVEGLPNAICEGMYYGKPIIMTPISDYEILVGNENGYVAKDTSAEAIAEVLTLVAKTSSEDLKRMGEISKEKAEKLFSKEIICAAWHSLIKEQLKVEK